MRIVFFTIFSLCLLTNSAFSANPLPDPGNFINAGLKTGLMGKGITTPQVIDAIDGALSDGLVSILQIIYQIGLIVAVCVFTFMGVQLIISSPQKKAQLKSALFPYFTGLLLFIAGVPIAILIINIITQIF